MLASPATRRIVLGAALLAGAAAIALLAFVVVSGSDEEVAAVPENGRYESQAARYSFDYPRQWQDLEDRVKFEVPPDLQLLDAVVVGYMESEPELFNGVQVTVTRIDRVVPREGIEGELTRLDQIFRDGAAAARAEFHEPAWVELGGLKARQYITEFLLGSSSGIVEVASARVVTYFGDRQYAVNCQGRVADFDARVLAGCEQVLQSFRFR
jgi:hypothetical protein